MRRRHSAVRSAPHRQLNVLKAHCTPLFPCAHHPQPMRFKSDRPANKRPLVPSRSEPLNDQRFNDLIGKASAFFATFERDLQGERAAAIEEINARMVEYGLTLEDLMDPAGSASPRRDGSPH